MKIKSLRLILNLAKQKDKKKFLNAIEESKLLDNIEQLNSKDTSQLIYSFSKVEINDMRYWKQLNKQFLKTQQTMNTVDLVMCSYAFAKNYLSNPSRYMHKENQEVITSIWSQLEVSIIKHQQELLLSQQQSSNIGLLMYSFHILNKGTPEFWQMMVDILIKQNEYLDQRNLSMCCYVLSKRNVSDDKVWKPIRNQLIHKLKEFTWKNVMLIIYSFSKMNKADQELWSIFEETVMFQTDRRSIKHSNQFGGTILAGRDLSQILWSFASLKQGSPNFWEMMENLLMDNAHAIDFKTFNKCLFSFYFAEKGSIEFWQYISKMNLNIPQKYLDASLLDDILFLSRIFQIKSDENVAEFNFNPLIQKFNQIVSSNQNEQILLNSRARLCYHQILLEKDNDLQQQNIFDIYLKKLQASSQQEDQKQWLQMYIDFTYMVFTLNLQDKFYNCLIEANRILINKMTKKDKSQEESSDEDEPSNIIEGMSRQIQEDESDDDQFQIGDQQEKYFSKQYSGISWVLYLNINESKQIPFEHKLELLDFLYNNFNIFLETDKKFSQIIQKILQPISGDKRVFEFFLQKLTSSKVNNPLQHFYLIFLICIKNNYRLDTYNLKNLLVQPKDQKQFEKEYQKIITKYKQMYAEPSRFDINQLLDQVLSHFIFPKQKVEDIVHFYKEQQQQANNLTSEFQQIKQDSMVSEKESDIEQIKTFMYENQSQEEKI